MKKIFAIISVLFCGMSISFASESSFIKTYPVKGMFLSNGITCQEFKKFYNDKVKKKFLIDKFVVGYNNTFDDVISEVNEHNKYRTIVSYISIPRVSKYIDKKPAGDVIYFPLTVSLSFANVVTGETLYSTSKTVYGITQTDDYKIAEIFFQENYDKALKEVLLTAKNNFHPFEIPVRIIDIYKNLFILDKGIESGIVEDDELFDDNSNQLTIIYSTNGYSIAKNIFENTISGDSIFIKQVNNGGVNQIKKPKVLLINDVGNEMIYDLLSTSLGKDSKINLVTINPTFNSMRNTVLRMNKLSSIENEQFQRNLPDYFLYFVFSKPAKSTIIMNTSGLKNEYFSMMACGIIFDKMGKIVFSQFANAHSDNRASANQYGADDVDRVEILSKNLIENLSNKINTQIEFKEFEYKIKNISKDEIVLEDKFENLMEGNSIIIYKKVNLNNREILIPLYKYNVVEVSKNIVKCKFDSSYVDNAEKISKSNIAKSSMINAPNGSKFYKTINDDMELSENMIKLSNFERFITPIIGSGLNKPLILEDNTIKSKVLMINNSSMFKNELIIPVSDSNLFVKPMYKIVLKKHKVKGFIQINTYKVYAKIELYNNDKKLAQKELFQDVELTLPLKNYEEILNSELQNVLCELFQVVARSFK